MFWIFQELPCVLLPVIGSFRGGQEGVQVAVPWRVLLPQAGTNNLPASIKQKVHVLLVALQLISNKWGPCSFWKSSQLPAHTLCCMLMKFPLFPIRRTLSPDPKPPRFLLCCPPVLVPIWPCFHCWYSPTTNLCIVLAAKLQDRRWRRPAARLWAASASDGDGGVSPLHQEAVSETVRLHGNNVLTTYSKEWNHGLMSPTRSRNVLLKTFCLFGIYKLHLPEKV